MKKSLIPILFAFSTSCFCSDINSDKCFDELYEERTKTLDELYKLQLQHVQQRKPFDNLIIKERRFIEKICKKYVDCEEIESNERSSTLDPFIKSTIFESCIVGEEKNE